ncbi:MAG: LLM class flavin-dependent oxidoreductase [Chloroflexota bacterium]
MEFAFLTTHSATDAVEDPHQTILDARELVQLLDQAGFDMIWFPEHHFIRSYTSPAPIVAAVDAANRVKRARVGTSVILAPMHNPLLLAGEIAYADHLTDGRIEFGFARGASDYEVTRFQISRIEAAERTRECVEAVIGLLTTEDFSFQGKYWQFPPTTSIPRPFQKPHPRLWLASRSPETVSFTIEKQLGMMLTVQQEDLPRLRAQIALVDALVDELEEYPRPPLSVARQVYVTHDKRDALEAMELVARMRAISFQHRHDNADIRGGYLAPAPMPEGTDISPEELMRRLVVGDPETVVEKLKEIEAMDVDQFVVNMDWGQPQEKIRRSLELFATDVMPHFRSSASTTGSAIPPAELVHS